MRSAPDCAHPRLREVALLRGHRDVGEQNRDAWVRDMMPAYGFAKHEGSKG